MRPFDDVFAASALPGPSSPSPAGSGAGGGKSRPSSVTSRSPSPGSRNSHGTASASSGGPAGLTFFLTEENNFGVHSMSESHLAGSVRTPLPPAAPAAPSAPASPVLDADIVDKADDVADQDGNTETAEPFAAEGTLFVDSPNRPENRPIVEPVAATLRSGSSCPGTISAIPAHVFDRAACLGHFHTPSIGSTLSPTISTPSSPRLNLSSSLISEDSELDLAALQEEDTVASTSEGLGSSVPQLVMPKVNMPRRKAFTETGWTMGKLKIMVVGDSGIGKSSLIQAFLNTSPDIVHYDPPQPVTSTSTSSISSSFMKTSVSSQRSALEHNMIPPTDTILEIKASTRAYPAWWKTETERDAKTHRPPLARRESVGEVLERNICFIDTPGYGSSDDFNDVLARVSSYIEENYEKTNNLLNQNVNRPTDLLTLFSNGINSVDLVIYVVLHRLKPVDITIMRHLSTLTNIIPIIAKSDSLSHTQTLTLKLSLLRDLKANQIPIFTFGKSLSELERSVVNGMPFAISSLRDDIAEMDASLLMREEGTTERYVESDLPYFIAAIVENAGWLRFASTKKFVEWRTRTLFSSRQEDLIPFPSPSTSLISVPHTTASPSTTLSPIGNLVGSEGYAMAVVGDHIDREERLARVRLVQWASEMRRSIRRKMTIEREEFERIEAAERIKWLVAKLNDAIAQQDATESALVPVSPVGHSSAGRRRGSSGARKKGGQRVGTERDPLGLVWVTERWGPRLSRGVVWIVEAGVVFGSGWVVWKYVVDSGLSTWFMQNAARNP